MIRKLAFALALIGTSFTSAVHALGLGEATVSSSLNQPLSAEIELISLGSLEPQEVLPGLATREEFLKAGVDRVYFLSDLRFKVERNTQGKAVIVLTTNKPVREPFLNFLVEVIWPSGRLLREYALLIDPPVFSEEPAQPVAAPVSAPQATQQRETGDRLSMPLAQSQSVVASVQAETYGPTTSADTLWDIALKVRPNRSVSPQQVMLAIQDENPNAFIGDNINKLKAGQVLRLPSLEEMKQRSSAAAINEVIAQNQALKGGQTKPVVSAAKPAPAKSQSVASSASGADQLKLVVAESGSEAASTANSGDAAVETSGKGLEDELALTLEKLDKSSLENQELSTKVQDLEEQLETLQRLLTLKNDQLASLQASARQAEMEQAQAEESAQDQAVQQEGIAESPVTQVENEALEQVGVAQEEVEAAGDAVAVNADQAVTESAAAETQAEEKAAEVVSEEPKPVAKPAAEKAFSGEPKRSTVDQIIQLVLDNPLYQALVAVALIILLLILWLVSKNNAKREAEANAAEELDEVEGFDESEEFQGFEETVEEDVADLDEESVEATNDDLADELATEDLDLESGQQAGTAQEEPAEKEDIIAEADVYIAYGRLDQAASVLERGISAEPIRVDYRLKLLEVYAETGDQAAFDRQYSELEAIQDPEALDRADAIRADFAPQAPQEFEMPETSVNEVESLEAGSEPEEVLEPDLDLEAKAADNSFDFDSVEEELDEDDLGVDLSSDDLELDLDIDLESPELDSGAATESALEFSLDDESVDALSDTTADLHEVEELDETAAELAENDGAIEFSTEGLNLDESDLDAADEPSLSADAEDVETDALELELGDLELSEELEKESEIDLPDDLSIPDEMLDIELDDEDESELASGLEATVEESLDSEEALVSAEDLDLGEELLEAGDELSADTLALDDDEPVSTAVVSDDILEEAEEALAESDDELDADLGDEEDFDFLDGTDEASTKLDLARAYIDMGDVEGARDILLEVEKEGSPEQQADARALIDSLQS